MKLFSRNRGFTMVELTVVVGILTALAGSTLVGFNYFGDVIKAREASGFTGDILRQSELSVLQGDIQKITVHFLTDYLVLEETPVETGATLTFDPADTCITAGSNGTLTRKDEDDRSLEIRAVTAGEKICVVFKSAAEREWKYQLMGEDGSSSVFRFIHFNLGTDYQLKNPQDLTDNLCSHGDALSPNLTYRLEIQAPYAKKQLYIANALETDPAALLFCGPGAETGEFINLQY